MVVAAELNAEMCGKPNILRRTHSRLFKKLAGTGTEYDTLDL